MDVPDEVIVNLRYDTEDGKPRKWQDVVDIINRRYGVNMNRVTARKRLARLEQKQADGTGERIPATRCLPREWGTLPQFWLTNYIGLCLLDEIRVRRGQRLDAYRSLRLAKFRKELAELGRVIGYAGERDGFYLTRRRNGDPVFEYPPQIPSERLDARRR